MDYNCKKKMNDKINKVKDKEIFKEIFELAQAELYTENGEKNFSHNNNGIFFDLNKLSDKILYQIEDLLNENLIVTTESETGSNIKYSPYSTDEIGNYKNMGPRLSNQEKNIITNIQKDK
jgi:hypothetical protein